VAYNPQLFGSVYYCRGGFGVINAGSFDYT